MATKIVSRAVEETQADVPPETSPAVHNYRILRALWDGQMLHPRGSILPFTEGTQPQFAIKIELSTDGTGVDEGEDEK